MICMVVGARPNFMKMAPVILEARRRGVEHFVVHTGQHYDAAMSQVFFDELGMPQPDMYMGVGSGTHATQTARVMTAFEEICNEKKPRLVLVAGDVNSTLACGLVAAKLQIPVAHLESGLRSNDRTMPEEINRVLTDHLSDLLLTTEPSGAENLRREGIAEEAIFFVGNCMIDSLETHREAAVAKAPWKNFDLEPGGYGLVTLHRPAAVDEPERLEELRAALCAIAADLPLLFPVHPRTRARIENSGASWNPVRLVDPLGYLDFLGLMAKARLVLTDSGGVQEETTALGVPCLTLRENTERPVTVEEGTNRLIGLRGEAILSAAQEILSSDAALAGARVPELWDGRAATRVMDLIQDYGMAPTA